MPQQTLSSPDRNDSYASTLVGSSLGTAPPSPDLSDSGLTHVREVQREWQNIERDLPPQLSHRHIRMISIGGVIGTGLFLGSANALYYGGPIGALLGYSIIGTVVYCLCVSIGEMIAFLPNVGGVVGLADLYVDPALGFSLGWAGWYNWSIALPVEITAAAFVVGFWYPSHHIPVYLLYILTSIFLCLATAINMFPSHVYGEVEYWLSMFKTGTIIMISMFLLGALITPWVRCTGSLY